LLEGALIVALVHDVYASKNVHSVALRASCSTSKASAVSLGKRT